MKEEDFYNLIGKRIKSLRKMKHLSQEQLAEKSGLSLDYIGKIEVNINKPGLKALLKISNAAMATARELTDENAARKYLSAVIGLVNSIGSVYPVCSKKRNY